MNQHNIPEQFRRLSYSSLLTLHSCPRKFQLDKLGVNAGISTQSVTFAYGHAVGAGTQALLSGASIESAVWEAWLAWDYPDLYAENTSQKKSFHEAYLALIKVQDMIADGLLDGYTVLMYNGKPACELGFKIILPNGFTYRGYVDIVMQHEDGRVLVVELKTTSAYSINPAQYKHSAQALGYSLVLDHVLPNQKNYEVTYLAYLTKSQTWERLDFIKSYAQRAQFIRDVMLDVEFIMARDAEDYWPMRGESCMQYMSPCKHIDSCSISDKYLLPQELDVMPADDEYDIVLELDNLIMGMLPS